MNKFPAYDPTGVRIEKNDAELVAEGARQPLKRQKVAESRRMTPNWLPRVLGNHSSVRKWQDREE